MSTDRASLGAKGARATLQSACILAAGASLVAAVLSACGGASATAAPSPKLPDATTTIGTHTVAAIAMGNLTDPTNTFWQLFSRVGAARWVLVTPPGVATNGGILATTTRTTAILSAIGPFGGLKFSPLARSSDGGATWDPGVLPGPVAPYPDALGASDGPDVVALLAGRTSELVESTGSLYSWTKIATLASLDAAARSCRFSSLTAVSIGPSRATLIGGSCIAASAPIVERVRNRWVEVGPPLGTRASRRVVRLVGTSRGAVSVIEEDAIGGDEVESAVSDNRFASWQSAAIVIGAGHVVASSVTTLGAATVIVATSNGSLEAFASPAPGAPWLRLPPPPALTVVVTAGALSTIQALAVDHSVLTAYGLVDGRWQTVQRMAVPILYGSSG